MRSFKPYPAYKDSGVEWLGEIPAHWEVKRLKYLTCFSTGWTPPTGRDEFYGGEHLWANISDLGPRVLVQTENTISDTAVRESRLSKVPAGSLLFSFKLSVGTVSIAGEDMYTNEAIAAFTPSDRIDIDYLFWSAPLLVVRNAQENIYGAPLLNRDRIANATLLCPPLPEQRAIAAFLDRETAKIDALVEKKERLISLLQEKRTALISHAVTKGLDPTVPMKDSGVEWLGAIPAHWEVKPLKRALRLAASDGSLIKGQMHQEPLDGLFPGFSASGQDVWVEEAQHHGPGIVLSAVGARCGKTFKADGSWTAVANTHVLFPQPGNDRDFLWYVTNNELFWDRGGTAQPFVRTQATLDRPWCFPPLPEQRAIAAFLDRETAKIDALIAKVREAIARLKEYRTALISAAVTGKIKTEG